MTIKKFDEFEKINETMEYTSFFGKKVSHESALQKRIRDLISNIIMDELKISEKSFKQYDQVIEIVKDVCGKNEKIYEESEEYYTDGKRLNFLAEKVYDEYFKTLPTLKDLQNKNK